MREEKKRRLSAQLTNREIMINETCPKKLHIILLQLPHPKFSLKKHWGNTPLAAGYLKSMAHKQHLLDEVEIEILAAETTNLDTDSRLIEVLHEKKPDIIGFSLYVWNSARSLYIMGKLREQLPEVKFLAGGPEVTQDNDFILSSPQIDIGCIGEGEITFVEIIKNLLRQNSDLKDINGIFFRHAGALVFTEPREPIKNLDEIPSPYILGFLNPRDYGYGWIEASRGCHNKCEFCAWRDRPKGSFSSDRIIKELEVIKKSGVRRVKFLDSDVVNALHHDNLANKIRETNLDGKLQFFGFTSAERIDEKEAENLQKLNFTCLGIGLQSTNPQTLKNLGRKPNLDKFVHGCRRLKEKSIRLELEFIIGLPNDTLADFKNILTFIRQNKLLAGNQLTQFHLLLLPGTALRRKSAAYGISYQQTPPYQIMNSEYIPTEDIQAAIRLNRKGKKSAIHRSLITSFGTGIRHCINNLKIPSELAGVTQQISRILLDIDPQQQTTQELARVAECFNGIVRQPLTVWFKLVTVTDSLPLIITFLRRIVARNPFILLNIFLETETGKFFNYEDIEEILNLPIKEKTITANGIEKAVRISAILPGDFCKKISSVNLKHLTQKIHFFRSLQITSGSNWQSLFNNTRDEHLYEGYIVNFDPDYQESRKIEFIQFLRQLEPQTTKRVRFREAALDFSFQTLLKNTITKPDYVETIVSLNSDLTVDKFFKPDLTTKVDMLATQIHLHKHCSK